jgi:hypothetical protein
MAQQHSLWHAVRWPSVVLLVGVVGTVAATILDEVYASEWSLTIGAPSLWLLLPFGAVWLVVALVIHIAHHRRAG